MKHSVLFSLTLISLKQLQDFLIVHQTFYHRLKYCPNKQFILNLLALLKFHLRNAENRMEHLSDYIVSKSTRKATRGQKTLYTFLNLSEYILGCYALLILRVENHCYPPKQSNISWTLGIGCLSVIVLLSNLWYSIPKCKVPSFLWTYTIGLAYAKFDFLSIH